MLLPTIVEGQMVDVQAFKMRSNCIVTHPLKSNLPDVLQLLKIKAYAKGSQKTMNKTG